METEKLEQESELKKYLDAIEKDIEYPSDPNYDFLKHHNSEECADEIMTLSPENLRTPENLRILKKHEEQFKLILHEDLTK